MAIYHVAVTGCDRACGSEQAPFRSINQAARVAVPGDKVVVHEGTYREWVDPPNGGLNDVLRITYEAAPGEKPVIKGSEVITGWEKYKGAVWKKVLPNSMFGDWNPYKEPVAGDWLMTPVKTDYQVHLGDVYLNGVSMYEARTLEDVIKAEKREWGFQLVGKKVKEKILNPEGTVYQWYAEVDDETTTLYVNFQAYDPNQELVEINVRQCCFYPRRIGVNYITLRGFEIAHAACPFTPPTADQPGMVGAHWSKGWIIEKNHLHDAKCSAISIGKEASTGHNLYSRYDRKPGYQYQMEAVFLGLQMGWSKEKIGSHIIRDNEIHDCGQNGVVGHMGCAFSQITHNHIYNIAVKHEFFGYEIGGIKLHAAVDVIIQGNNIHNCTLGTWLDWQAQGTRVTKNVYHHNDRDLMIEVTHGPCLVDNNIFASLHNFDNMAQGTAYVHNLSCGYMNRLAVLDRATPYHFPHSTQVAGCAVVYSGDDRMINNIYAANGDPYAEDHYAGTAGYDSCTAPEEYTQQLENEGNTDAAKFYKIPQPVYVQGNAYAGKSKAFRGEKAAVLREPITADVTCESGAWVLDIAVPESLAVLKTEPCTTARLGFPRITEQSYDNPDGTPVDFTYDILGGKREGCVTPGPFAALEAGQHKIKVWEA